MTAADRVQLAVGDHALPERATGVGGDEHDALARCGHFASPLQVVIDGGRRKDGGQHGPAMNWNVFAHRHPSAQCRAGQHGRTCARAQLGHTGPGARAAASPSTMVS